MERDNYLDIISGISEGISANPEKYIAAIFVSGIDYLKEREKWRSKIEILRLSYEDKRFSQINEFEKYEAQLNLAKELIDRLSESGNHDGMLFVFQTIINNGPDFLSNTIATIDSELKAIEN